MNGCVAEQPESLLTLGDPSQLASGQRTPRHGRFGNQLGGFSAGSDERMAKRANAEARVRRGAQARAALNPVSRFGFDQLPAEFADEAAARVEYHVRCGNWSQAIATVKALADEWELWKINDTILTDLPLGQRLACHVTRLGLSRQTTEMVDRECCGTLGSLLEVFPLAFVGTMCGPVRIKELAMALVRAGVLEPADALAKMALWEAEMERARIRKELRPVKMGR